MFIGHFAPAMLAATHKQAPSLPILFVAAQLVDWAFFVLVLAGVEKLRFSPGISVMNPMDLYHMPYTHSLLGTAVWAGVFAALVMALTKNRMGALLVAAVVLSHWLLDWLVHVPDMTLIGTPPKLGLGLWNYPLIEMPLELILTFGCLWLYASARKPAKKQLMTLAGVLLSLQLFNWVGGGESGSITTMAIMALLAFAAMTGFAWWSARSEAKN